MAFGVAYRDAAVPLSALWTSPFARWGGALSHVSSLDLAAVVTDRALRERGIDRSAVEGLVLGWTVPQPALFYGATTLAARLGMPGVGGPMLSQACATSVAALHQAAASVGTGAGPHLVVTTDRTSNGPELTWPPPGGPGHDPVRENWVRDSFARDPVTGRSMLATAEAVAAECGFTRGDLDSLAVLRFEQYADALAGERAFQRAFMVGVELGQDGGEGVRLSADEGVRAVTADGAARLPTVRAGGTHTAAAQTHPADGTAGALVTDVRGAGELAGRGPVVRLVASGFARVEPARMPKALVPAARAALHTAGLKLDAMDAIGTHNPFAVNDLYFARETGVALDAMNVRGSSLVFGHPQGPTGLRAVTELAHVLRARGGGLGLFTGCAAGDTAAALVVEVTD
ncbi:acetyl-CoA acetyltransferase [Streptomyces cyaneogriseus subsp. noncyanogenus]|uniref:Probable acetyl-CoA acetyltransferase n=1 Tax=Streptomyces cyaneogriseus subsp. noncyanogenus TaxID=477245 RepID=A0A0C5GAH5_9ACTN|nr:thiolase family protein [Streptomyces cyaneogriseus]AJP05329.1 acetyl-CoA acetyltransferase [Streptomyces cyaneogriseus subsp. noncyanogenus]